MKTKIEILIFCLIFCTTIFAQTKPDKPRLRAEFEARITMPFDGKFPQKAFNDANNRVESIFRDRKNARTNTAIPNITWKERGPFNIGGRTRSIMYESSSSNKVWAGSVSGGLWYNNDITNSASVWQKVSDFWDNLSVTSIAKANSTTFYVGTGERRKGGGPASRGGGIWKSINAGATWFQLPNTNPSVDGNFYHIQKIEVDGTGKIYAACSGGLMESSDGGYNWSRTSGGDYDDVEIAAFNVVIASRRQGNQSRIIKIEGNFLYNITPTYTGNGQRIELALAPSTFGNSLTIYAICIDGKDPANPNGDVLWFKKSTDAGITWSNITIPVYEANGAGNGFFTFTNNGGGNQGDYNLTMAVHPSNPNLVIVGGATNARSLNGGSSWSSANYRGNMHPDIHTIEFSPVNNNHVIFGNDGGVNFSTTYGDATATISTTAPGTNFAERNTGFRVTEFYKAAMKNIANDIYTLAGAQDNGTIKMTQYNEYSNGTDVGGGDGMNCYIDQDNANIQIISQQNLNHFLLNPTTNTKTPLIVKPNGQGFLNPTDYDSQNNVFWVYYKTDTLNSTHESTYLFKVNNVGGTTTTDSIVVAERIFPYFIKAGKTANTIFVGAAFGKLYKIVANPATNSSTITDISPPSVAFPAYSWDGEAVFSMDIGATEQELILVKSNYGVQSVFYSANGGTSWISKDEATHGLPDMPIFAALFNPLNRNQVLLATELGVWSTMAITSANPDWQPTTASLAHVRCMSFEYRSADNTVLVATFGRGVFFSKLNQPCLANITNFTIASGGSAHYEASNSISLSASLPKGSISLDSGGSLVLTSGFKVNNGTSLKAYIDGCGGTR